MVESGRVARLQMMLWLAKEAPRILKAGRVRRVDSSLIVRVPMLRFCAREGRGMRGVAW